MDYLKPAVAHALLILANEENIGLTKKQRGRLNLVADGVTVRGVAHVEFVSQRDVVACVNRAGGKVMQAIGESVKLRKGV
ncbi:MAG: hypothetical protein WAV41_02300 [Microgenomates group bacterium]